MTLIERKILGGVQIRKGPDKLMFKGILQPFSDGIKLFIKENFVVFFYSNKLLYNLFPIFFIVVILIMWYLFVYLFEEYFTFRRMFIVLVSGVGVYGLFGAGWASNSKYGLLGAYRRVAQTISYEVRIIFIVITVMLFINSYRINKIQIFMKYFSINFVWGLSLVLMVWLFIILAELNRTPFDFSERESELVSGFNIEYGGGKFAFLFLAEYGNILFISYLRIILFVFDNWRAIILVILFYIVVIRGVLPRIRYDLMIKLNWEFILPDVLLLFIIFFLVFK